MKNLTQRLQSIKAEAKPPIGQIEPPVVQFSARPCVTVCDIKTVHANKTVNAWSGLCLLVLFKTDSLTHSSKNLQVMKKFQSYLWSYGIR